MGSIQSLAGTESYAYCRQFVYKLNRVRKILAEAAENDSPKITAKLKVILEACVVNYEEAYAKFDDEINNAKGGVTLSEPNEYYRCATTAPSCVYLLGEFRAYDALPILSRIYSRKGRVPVPRVFLYYAMHLLVAEHPREKLSEESARALDEYLEAAKLIPNPMAAKFSAWNAKYEESDFRLALVPESNIDLTKEPSLTLRIYPGKLDEMETTLRGTQSDEVDRLFEKLRMFVRSTYPE